ncbi:MAG: hypothetical protein EA392_10795 [Cryomorphaceae bacterium]|nr:MAG: hypothetical protein EA392_10795 [Cryomorphaceae bacterium]
MITTVLFPTDFSIGSLAFLKTALNKRKDEKIEVVLAHGMHLSDSITELLFFSKTRTLKRLTNHEYEQAVELIWNKYGTLLVDIRKEIVIGHNQEFVDKFIESQGIQEAYIPVGYKPNLHNSLSYDLTPFIAQSDIRIHKLDWKGVEGLHGEAQLADMFFDGVTANS